MKKLLPYLAVLGAMIHSSCSEETSTIPEETASQNEARGLSVMTDIRSKVQTRYFYALVKEEALSNMRITTNGKISLASAPNRLQSTMHKVGVTKMQRLFGDAGKYEERTRREGLHRWMLVEIAPQKDVLVAVATLKNQSEFEIVEPAPRYSLPKFTYSPLSEVEAATTRATTNLPFDDPMLPKQWHYHNDGSLRGAVAGADINLFKAWEMEVGRPEVIVCIVDGGVDLGHEDLAQNVNAELSSCYILNPQSTGPEDKYKDKIYPDDAGHGTHVAGTVAAVNNNGIGVAGVAGGNGSQNSGIRMISHQIFGKLGSMGQSLEDSNSAAAIKDAADKGAVISQNSWGQGYRSTAIEDAIRYFVKYAGCDNDGKQLPNSPMKGGVVIFAAGNENTDGPSFPADNNAVIAVSSFGYDWIRASYTNRGAWVNIAAPGGDQDRHGTRGGVLSTMPTSIDSKGYGYMQGTSMACPHVSGVAALIASRYAGPGFTNEDLKRILLTALRPYDIYAYNSEYKGRLGVGYIDAAAAVEENKKIAPDKPELKSKPTPSFDYATVEWGVATDKDAIDGVANYYHLYISNKTITRADLAKLPYKRIFSNGKKAGETLAHTFRDLQDNTPYHYAVVAVDRWDLASEPLLGEFTTLENHAPEMTGNVPEGELLLLSTSVLRYTLTVKDIDGHSWTHELKSDYRGVRISRRNDILSLTINPIQEPGVYPFSIVLKDELGKERTYDYKYRIVKYQAPRLVAQFDNMILGSNDAAFTIDLSDKFAYSDGLKVTYKASSGDEGVLSATVEGTQLKLKGAKPGRTSVSIEINDGIKRAQGSFEVRVVSDSRAAVYGFYPNPVKDRLNALINPSVSEVTFVVTTLRGEEVLRKKVQRGSDHVASLSASKLAVGTYRLTILSNKDRYQSTFVKQ